MSNWTDWTPNEDNPYLVWRSYTASEEDNQRNTGLANFEAFGLSGFSQHIIDFLNSKARTSGDKSSPKRSYQQALEELNAPLPGAVLSNNADALVTSLPDPDDLPVLTTKDTVIVGVIDIGIPLGHARLRDKDGKSRVLAAWQQLATDPTDYLPFGRELLKPEIDRLIAECSGGSHTGWLDEESFNRASGVVDMDNPYGVREAARFAAHGAHVTDLAAGCDPFVEPEFAEKVKVIAVNMPNVDVVGHSGEFTDGFVLAAVERILTLADAIWHKSFGDQDAASPEPCPCPIVINISLGKQAGAKNSMDLFPAHLHFLRKDRESRALDPILDRAIAAIQDDDLAPAVAVLGGAAFAYADATNDAANAGAEAQKDAETAAWEKIQEKKADGVSDSTALLKAAFSSIKGWVWPNSTLNVVIPVGNDNLSRCNAFLEPPSGSTASLNWRILPDDQSPNFVEVWVSPDQDNPNLLAEPNNKLQVRLISPSGEVSPEIAPIHNAMSFCAQKAAVFWERHQFKDRDDLVSVMRCVFCVAPTERARLDQETAEAGMWRIEVTNGLGADIQCVCSIQTDQGVLPGASISRRSYFDDPNYVQYNAYEGMGDRRETYAYPDDPAITAMSGQQLNLDIVPTARLGATSPVKRHGTMNATAAHKQVARVAGYRHSDGRPAFYSATGRGRVPFTRDQNETPIAVDDGTRVRPTYDDDNSRAPTASLPVEDGPMHPGIMGAGGANGSVVALRGTSFAAPQAARLIAQELIKRQYTDQSGKQRLMHRARLVEDTDAGATYATHPRPNDYIEVLGRGRIKSTVRRAVSRMDFDGQK